MSYLSPEFIAVFLPFFALYWCVRARVDVQNHLLLAASYALVATYSLLFALELLLYSAFIYLAARNIQYYRSKKQLKIAIAIAIGHLCLMKYLDFFRLHSQNLLDTLGIDWQLPAVEILLPIGISYYTFHSITYLVAAYRVQIVVEKPERLCLFLAFFPTLIAGPICRAGVMMPQFAATAPRAVGDSGRIFVLLISGLIKVVWLEAWLKENWVTPILGNPEQYLPTEVLAALYAYTLEIYLNFSGYTDLVTAIALLLGIRIPENFNMPYAATNLRDFWHRWHISLSTWIRDYLYIPLGGSRQNFARTQINLLLAMMFSGIWHGYGWNFLIWGTLHGIALVWLNIGKKWFKGKKLSNTAIGKWLAIFITFHFVSFTFVIFNARDLDSARLMFQSLLYNGKGWAISNWYNIGLIAAFALMIAAYPLLSKLFQYAVSALEKIPLWLWFIPITLALMLIITFAPSGLPNFIYANF